MATPSPASSSMLLIPRLVWLALLASQGIYTALLLVPGLLERPSSPPDDGVLAGLIAAAAGCAVASFVVPRLVLRTAVAAKRFELREVPDASAPVGFRGATPTVREYADVAAVRTAARAAGMAPLIVSLALSETISLTGVVSGLLGAPPVVWGAFVAAGMTLTAIRFPTEATFLGPVEQHTGVRVPR